MQFPLLDFGRHWWSTSFSSCLLSIGLLSVAASPSVSLEPAKTTDAERVRVAVEALRRLKGVDLESNPAVKAALLNVLKSVEGSAQFVELVREFNLPGQSPALLAYAVRHPQETAAVDALRQVIASGDLELIQTELRERPSADLIRLLANVPDRELVPVLGQIAVDPNQPVDLRKHTFAALAQHREGAELLLPLAREPVVPEELRAAVRPLLMNSRWPEIRAEAAELAVSATGQADPLPPVSQMVAMKGDAGRGRGVFARETVGCARCHQVHGQGIDFGPDLSEIGTKLAKEAIYEAILDPSAGLSFGYEPWKVELTNGEEVYGLLASETAEELAIKTQNGIVTRYRKQEIADKSQQRTSVMPAGLELTMSRQDLVDLVEYLASLRKPAELGQAK